MEPKPGFETWWHREGSGLYPLPSEDLEEFAHRVTEIAWENGEYTERERANLASQVGSNHYATLSEVFAELDRATAKFPTWPTDPLHAFAVVGEEHGELQKELLQLVYEPHKSTPESVRTEAVQLAAMSLRFLMSLDKYQYQPLPQHKQE